MSLKRVVLMVALALLLAPSALWADSIDFSFVGGTLSGGAAGVSSAGAPSTLTAVTRLPGGVPFTGILGTVSLTTGVLTSGSSATTSGTFSAVGSGITIATNGSGGLPAGSSSFVFTGPITWTTLGTSYALMGTISGPIDPLLLALLFPECTTCYLGSQTGALITLTVAGSVPFNGSAAISSGDINVAVPEPGTLALFGTGLIGIAGLIRHRSKA